MYKNPKLLHCSNDKAIKEGLELLFLSPNTVWFALWRKKQSFRYCEDRRQISQAFFVTAATLRMIMPRRYTSWHSVLAYSLACRLICVANILFWSIWIVCYFSSTHVICQTITIKNSMPVSECCSIRYARDGDCPYDLFVRIPSSEQAADSLGHVIYHF